MKNDETDQLENESIPLRNVVIDSIKSGKLSSEVDHAVIASVYDPYTDDTIKGRVSYYRIMTHIIVISFGPTMLSLPSNFMKVGYIAGIVGILITVFLYALCVRILISNEYELCRRKKVPSMSYAIVTELAWRCGPPPFRRLAKYTRLIVYVIFLSIWTFGSSLIFLLAAENMKKFYDFVSHQSTDPSTSNNAVGLRFVMLSIITPCLLLCWIPNLKYLMYLSFFANATNILGIAVIAYYVVQDLPSIDNRSAMGNVEDIPLFIGNVFFTINATALMIPTKDEMKFKKYFAASRFDVLTVSYALVAVTYAVFGLLCYLKFGSDVHDSVIRNLPDTNFTRIVIGLYGIGNCCFYSLVAYVSQDVLWNDILKMYVLRKSVHQKRWKLACRTIVVFVSITAAFFLPNIELFLLITGTVGTSLDSLIIPAICQLLIKYEQQQAATPKRVAYGLYVRNGFIIVIGVVLMVVGSIDCIEKIARLIK